MENTASSALHKPRYSVSRRERNPEIRPNPELPLFAREWGVAGSNPAASNGVPQSGRGPQAGDVGSNPTLSTNGKSPANIAHARNSDPETSHQAAASVRIANLGRTRDGIMDVLKVNGQQTDEQIWETYSRWHDLGRTVPRSSPSGLRSRRSELVRMGFVEACGTGKTASGRPCTIWKIKDGAAYAAGA